MKDRYNVGFCGCGVRWSRFFGNISLQIQVIVDLGSRSGKPALAVCVLPMGDGSKRMLRILSVKREIDEKNF